MITNTRPHENGNAIWFVLVAVALLAALTMAVTRSSDTTEQTGDIERVRIQASDLLRYIKGVEAAVDNMLLRGISESDVCFHDSGWGNNDYNGASCANSANRIFDIEGAGLTWRTFNYVTSWDIFGSHLVQDLETSNTDLIMQAQVSGALCRELNTMLGIPNTGGDAPEDDIQGIYRFNGSYAAAAPDNIIGDDDPVFAGKSAGCRKDGSDYYFYQVLIKR